MFLAFNSKFIRIPLFIVVIFLSWISFNLILRYPHHAELLASRLFFASHPPVMSHPGQQCLSEKNREFWESVTSPEPFPLIHLLTPKLLSLAFQSASTNKLHSVHISRKLIYQTSPQRQSNFIFFRRLDTARLKPDR